MRLYLLKAYESSLDQWLIFLLYARNREAAKREISHHCQREGFHVEKIFSHDITLGDDDIIRIDNLMHYN